MKNTIVGILVVGLGIGWAASSAQIDDDLKAELDAECFAKHGKDTSGQNMFSSTLLCSMTDEYKEAKKAEEEAEKILAEAKAAEEKRIAEAKAEAFRNSPEGKTDSFTSQAFTLCRQDVRTRAKFPTKVDFDWGGNASKYWMNFSEGKSRVMIQNTGEMMNGFGMMVPFKATCKYDYDPGANSYSTVEILI
tara:strand:- start:392 stop:964 length:573 start_codon:yes stop_codon:yes gene_type:complete